MSIKESNLAIFKPYSQKMISDILGTDNLNLYSLVECLTQRRREAESAEKSQKSEGKERYDKKRPENFFHPIGENNYDTN
jgi:hypothetical protein